MESIRSPKTILIVDDDNEMRWTLVSFLQDRGYILLEAESGMRALKLIQTEPIDLILSDIQMPNGDGIELITKLRASSNHPPLIFMSGGLGLSDSDLKELGASHFFSKPLATHELLEMIQIILNQAA